MKTKYKIFFAKLIYIFIKLFYRKENIKIFRNKITWNIDISEAIDLHLFIFGSFEKEISLTAKLLKLEKNRSILDIGANFGVQSLQFARIFPSSKIYSIEPTDFAYKKLLLNLELNPNLKKNIYPEQIFLGKKNSKLPDEIYSSWSLKSVSKTHEKHKGIKKTASHSKLLSLDDLLSQKSIVDLDFIKLDVDGTELFVLQSGQKFLSKKTPPIFMELAPYLYEENGYSLKDLLNYISDLKYSFYSISPLKKIKDIVNFSNEIKDGSSKNILLLKE
tara:strand:+ start:6533 stop:7357 length:825 start_codon:yes stop_codon:yes gene_type:complete